MNIKRLVLVSCTLLLAPTLFAQTGFPPYGSFQNGSFDTTNFQNLNTVFALPIVSTPGRHTPFNFSAVYNSSIWSQSGGAWVPAMAGLLTNWGWMTSYPIGVPTSSYTDNFGTCHVRGGPGDSYDSFTETQTWSNYTYVDTAGTPHPFTVWMTSVYNDCTGTWTFTGSYTGYATDGSGYYIDISGSLGSTLLIWTVDGTKLDFGSAPETMADTNGNFVAPTLIGTYETDWGDTSGRTSPGPAIRIINDYTSSVLTAIEYHYIDPSGTDQQITLKYQQYSVMTNFGCSGVTEYNGSGTMGQISLPYELDLPNGQKYQFSYEGTPGHSGYVTGRMSEVILPTGGNYQYDYSYSGSSNDGINCTDSSINHLQRLISDGTNTATWQYDRASIGSGNWATTVTAPQMPYDSAANQSVYQFDSVGQETGEFNYQGSSSTGTEQRIVSLGWASNGTPSDQITTIYATNQNIETDTTYDTYGHLDQMIEYDWGSSGARGSVLRNTTYTYATISGHHSFLALSEKLVKDGSGTIQYRQDIGYDGASPTCYTGVYHHDDSNYGCSWNNRGNPTAVTTYTSPAIPSGGIAKSFTYDIFGNVVTAQVNCCQQKQFNYSSATYYSGPDSIVSGTSPTLTVSATYNAAGLVATSTDENSQATSYTYDLIKRLTTITRPDSTQLTTCYSDISSGPCHSSTPSITSTTPIASGASQNQITVFDGLARPITTTLQDGSSTTYSIVQSNYDLIGRIYQTSNPYTGSPSYWTKQQYDLFGRPTVTIYPDNSQATASYSGNCATTTDQAGNQKKSCTDGVGRLSQVYEPDVTTTGNPLTIQTAYTYTVLDALAQVTQGVQTRTYNYDGLDRLTNFTTPEAGTFYYQYNSYNLLTQRTDARGVITTYSYDTLNRPYQITYNVGSTGVTAAPTVTYSYGSSSTSNNNGRLITVSDSVTGSEGYTYNLLGEITQVQKVIGSITYNTYYSYNLAGEVSQITYPSGRVVAQSYDAIGRLCAIGASGSSCSTGTTYASGFGYNTAQQVTGFNYGNGVAASFGYSADRLQLTSLGYTSGSTTLFSLGYSYGSSSTNNGQIASITDNVDGGRTVNYTYDALYRLSGAETNGSTGYPQWGMSWVYDRYGNRTQQNWVAGSVPTNSLTISASTNRIATGSGFGYDSNGNMTGDGTNTLAYDSENHAITSSGSGGTAQYVYDGNGIRVEKCLSSCGSPTTSTVYIFAGSKVLAEYDNGAAVGSPSREYLYNGGQLMATIDSSGMKYHLADHLSVRATTDGSGSKIGDQGHYPYGDLWYAVNTTTNWFFTTYERDAESSNDYGQARYNVNRLGRFASPDPVAGNIADPQSFNRYSYVRNEPIGLIDPMGMDPCYNYSMRKENRLDLGDKGSGPSADSDTDAAPQQNGCASDGASSAGGGGGCVVGAPCFVTGSADPDGPVQDLPPSNPMPDPTGPLGGCNDIYDDGAYVGNTCDGSGTTPSKSGSGSGGGAITALNQAANWLSNAKFNKKNCLRDLGMLGVTPDRAQAGAANANIQNGVGSTIPLSSLYTSSPVPSVVQAGGSVSGTVGEKLAQPGVVAVAQLGGANIYVNVGMIQGGNSWNNRGLVLHEVLHNITGLTDPDIQLRLGLPQVVASNNITQKLITDCF